MDKHQAIYKLYPNVTHINDDVAYDINGQEVTYDKNAVDVWVDPEAYKAKRAAEYPSIVDQLDTLYHEGYEGWKAKIQAVKNKYPKGA
jgi:hypothetical protein